MNIFKKYFHYRELGRYKAQLKFFAAPLQRKENSFAINSSVNAAQKTLLFYKTKQHLNDAWNQYHNANINTISYKPHEEEFIEAMAKMRSAQDGWKVADDMLDFRKEIEIPWYARGFLINGEYYITWLFLIITIVLITTAFLVSSWELNVGIIILLFGRFLFESNVIHGAIGK